MFNSTEQIKRTYAMGLLIGGVFLVCGLILLRQVSVQSEREAMLSLHNSISQLRTLVQRQIALDFQTLSGVGISLNHIPEKEILSVLTEVNEKNAFLIMGLAEPDGAVDMVNIDGGGHHSTNLAGEAFFQEALAGRPALSGVRKNPFNAGEVIYSAVPVHGKDGVSGVLLGANGADTFRGILKVASDSAQGVACMVDKNGAFVLRGSATAPLGSDIFDSIWPQEVTPEQVRDDLQNGRDGAFFYTAESGRQFAVYEALDVNQWFLFRTMPAASLALAPNAMLFSVCAIIGLALLLAFFLLWRMRVISNRYRGELERLAFTDPLTGMRNVNRLTIDAAAILRRNAGQAFAVWYADIKNFKFYNEMFGYEMGDKELIRIAGLLAGKDSPLAFCCRVSADKFMGIRPMPSKEDFIQAFQRLCKRIENDPGRLSPVFPLILHMGVYSSDEAADGGLSFTDMANRANIALRVAREDRAGGCVFYSEDMRGLALRQLDMECRMEAALHEQQFKLYFQPKVDIQSGNRVNGAEVLARWHDGERLIPPFEFIPLFERNGFIVQLDRHMFSRACAWLQRHLGSGRPPISIAVNVSRLSIMQDDFVQYYGDVKGKYGIPDGLLELECTESLALYDERFPELVMGLQKIGFRCSLDDFGAGFSSLNVLKELPIDLLKLDMLFLRKSRDIKRERIVVSNIIRMAQDLGIRIVAEGVEHAEQVEFLRDHGCNLVQGYVFARPMPEDEFDALLENLRGGSIPLAQS